MSMIWDDKKVEIAYWLLGISKGEITSPASLLSSKARLDHNDDIEQKLKKQGLEKIFEEIELPLIGVLEKMEKLGIGINQQAVKKLTDSFQERTKKLDSEIKKIVGKDFNLNSPQQLAAVLFDTLNINNGKGRRTKMGHRSTNFSALENLKDAHPIINLIIDYRELFKLLSTYLEPWKLLGDRIYPTFLQTGTSTGRLSCQNPNLQNVPPVLRQVFVPARGYKLVSFDYSQVELRVLATVAQDAKMIDAFNNNVDIHQLTASQVFHVLLDQVTKEQRQLGKTLNFGVVYGMGTAAFAKTSGLKRAEAELFISEYFADFSRVRQWHEEVKKSLREKGYVENLNGRRRWLLSVFSGDPWQVAEAERAAINMPIQSLAADIIKMAMVKIDEEILRYTQNDVRMILTIHDELLFEIADDKLKESIPRIKDIMESVYKLAVPLKVEYAVGEGWGELK